MTKPPQCTNVPIPGAKTLAEVDVTAASQLAASAIFNAHAAVASMLPAAPEMQSSTACEPVSAVNASLDGTQHDYRSRPIEPEFEDVIKFKAIWLERLWPFRRGDAHDLGQELRVAWLSVRDDYAPSKGSIRSFLKTILERTAAKLRRQAVAEARRYSSQPSWDELLEGPRGPHIESSGDRRQLIIGRSLLSHVEAIQIQHDVPVALGHLPPSQAELWLQISNHTVAELHRRSGIPETTLHSRVTRLRKRFESPKFRDLL